MIWIINPMARIGSTILMIGFVAMKWAPMLNNSPLLSTIKSRFSAKWTHKNAIRKRPDKLSMTFFPIDDVKKLLIIRSIY
ncbi:hypothetical protein GCM10007041_21730 [Butyricimonas faecihominis]|nr:hypothetical protein Bfae18676_37070 [Butyricimonas faecihominis]GGJ32062.1 hypothetical protein GCM10007041_21730 [Butyricimonas faecihominis]